MAGKIQLTPAELLAQSQEMLSLQKDYDELFGRTETVLRQVNENWSARLANNFAGKLLSAQKSFSQVSAMLGQGGQLAADSANTFESMDSLLARAVLGGGTAGAAVSLASGTAERSGEVLGSQTAGNDSLWTTFWDETKESWNVAGSALEDIHRFLGDRIPEELQEATKEAAKKILGPLYSAYSITYDVVTGNADKDTGYTAVKAIFGGTKGGAIQHSVEYALEIGELDSQYQQTTMDQLFKGNVVTGIINMGGSFIDEIGTGLIDVGGAMTVDAVSKLPGFNILEEQLGFDLSESWNKTMDSFHSAATEEIRNFVKNVEKTEDRIQKAMSDGIEAAEKVMDKAVEKAADFACDVGSAVGDGLNNISDRIKSLWSR